MIGYRNPGNPEEAQEFTEAEQVIRTAMEVANKEVHAARNKLHAEEMRRSLIQVRCPHTVYEDRYDDPHDHRVCVVCGKSLGVI